MRDNRRVRAVAPSYERARDAVTAAGLACALAAFATSSGLPFGRVPVPVADEAVPAAAPPAVTVTPVSTSTPPLDLPVTRTTGDLRASPQRTPREVARLADLGPGLPATASFAYRFAAETLRRAAPECGLRWSLLAAIGDVESDHGRHGGTRLLPDGTTSAKIRGVPLDGRGPVARIRDTDDGKLDGDRRWDRGVGPMQFLPATWAVVGVDADGDGVRNPDDLDDAALAAAVYLCSGTPLRPGAGVEAAVHRYNPSAAYVARVVALERAYRTGAVAVLWPALSEPDLVVGVRVGAPGGRDDRGRSARTRQPATGTPRATLVSVAPVGVPSATLVPVVPSGPAEPTPAPTPTTTSTTTPTTEPSAPSEPTPTPAPDPTPAFDPVVGVLARDGDLWAVGATTVDVGDGEALAAAAEADHDGDGTVESNLDELTGLLDAEVEVTLGPPSPNGSEQETEGAPTLLTIAGAPYAAREPAAE